GAGGQPPVERLHRGERLGRQRLEVAQQLLHAASRAVQPSLGAVGQAVVAVVDADEGRVDRALTVVAREEPVQPGRQGRRARRRAAGSGGAPARRRGHAAPPAPAGRRPATGPSSGRSTQRRSWNERSTALIVSCTRAPSSKLPWFRPPPPRISSMKSLTRL